MTGKYSIYWVFFINFPLDHLFNVYKSEYFVLNIRSRINLDILFEIRFFSSSYSSQTLNVDITSPTFTDMNLRYAARRDGISASVSIPSTGFLGVQFNGRIPSQMSARVYSRYPVSIINITFLIQWKTKR